MMMNGNPGYVLVRLGAATLFLFVVLSGCSSQPPAAEPSSVTVIEDDASGATGNTQEAPPAAADAGDAMPEVSPDATSSETAEQATMEIEQPEYNQGDVIWIQQRLKDLGYYDGPVDGSVGKATRGAVIEYQRDQDVAADGQPTAELREFMWRNGG